VKVKIITADFETYYDKDIGFRTQTTEEYIRDPRFEVIGVAVQEDDGEPEWFSGSHAEIKEFLSQYDWANSFALAHNAIFDGAILNWHFNLRPKAWLDTLSMARPIHGIDAGGSLKALAERYEIGVKGTEVVNALGKKRFMFSAADLKQYGEYCKNDVALTYKLFNILNEDFPVKELKLIDLTIRMFTEPTIQINVPMLEQYLEELKVKKEELLHAAEAHKDIIMSNDKFAEALIALGVVPPMKISARTKKETWAFAKTDEAFKALLEHEEPAVQNLVAARLGVKTTIEETRTQRFINIGKRGALPVPLKYYAAHTGRWGGSDKVNLQNLPSRGNTAIKTSLVAPEGYTFIDCDSSQIEARTLAWLAGEDSLIKAFANGEDVYKIMAAKIYGKDAEAITKEERFFGKTVILGAGYGMGYKKFHLMLKLQNVNISESEAERIIKIYRASYPHIRNLWEQGNEALGAMLSKEYVRFGREGVITIIKDGFKLPSGLKLIYNNLTARQEGVPAGGSRTVYSYDSRREKNIHIYGGKVVENVVQAIARCIVGEQMIRISKKYRVVLTVHDAVMVLVRDYEAKEARDYVEQCMRWVPEWATGLPVDCESGVGKSYGEC
jgi:DNA polymerase I-like protein with 3'-5' exonuclease and polymerase domains